MSLSVIPSTFISSLKERQGSTLIDLVLVQKLQNILKKSFRLGHTDTITLKKDVIGMEKKNLFKWKH
ncbi:hypothetical protein OCB72_23175, partial [Bacillus cereus]|nr:hypothetical protein [Bacillus cereus]